MNIYIILGNFKKITFFYKQNESLNLIKLNYNFSLLNESFDG